jgi:hypothetical protein
VLAFCGLEVCNPNARLESVIATELRHHESGDQLLRDEPTVPEECKKLYFGLRSVLAQNDRGTDSNDGANGTALEIALNAFIANFDTQPAYHYFSRSRFANAPSAQRGQRLQKFLKSLRLVSS